MTAMPDFAWIIENRAFWDFCYEHCNYFTGASLAAALARAGLEPSETRLAFRGQYR